MIDQARGQRCGSQAIDLLQWLDQGRLVAELGHCNQNALTRPSGQVQFLWGGTMAWDSKLGRSAWQGQLLTMERSIHPPYPLIKQTRLLLHATHWTNQLIHAQMPEAWMVHPLEIIDLGSMPWRCSIAMGLMPWLPMGFGDRLMMAIVIPALNFMLRRLFLSPRRIQSCAMNVNRRPWRLAF